MPPAPSIALESPYIGRVAPSPTGALHFGSLVAAVGSFLEGAVVWGAHPCRCAVPQTA